MEAPPDERRSAAIQRFLARLAAMHRKDQGLFALAGANLQMLARRIVERSGRTGSTTSQRIASSTGTSGWPPRAAAL